MPREAGTGLRSAPEASHRAPIARAKAGIERTLLRRAPGSAGGASAVTVLISTRLGAYAELSKVGIVLLVLVSTAAGFMLSVPLGAEFRWGQGLLVLVGVMLLSCGASALNQVQERERDARMARTVRRPLPSGRLSRAQALAFSLVGIASGAVILWVGISAAAGVLGLVAALFYNGVYTPWLKPTSPFAAVPGAIPGSIPPVIGWVAGGGSFADTGALILFGILFLWQMPHFWALALRYRADYAAGGFPMVSETVGVEGTARLILLYAFGLTAWSLAAPTFHVGGPLTFLAAAGLGGRLIWLATRFARHPENERGWLSLFLFSNLYLLLLFVVMVGERLVRGVLP